MAHFPAGTLRVQRSFRHLRFLSSDSARTAPHETRPGRLAVRAVRACTSAKAEGQLLLRWLSRRRRRCGALGGLGSIRSRARGLGGRIGSGLGSIRSSACGLVSRRSRSRRRRCCLFSACGFLLRAGRQHQRGNNSAKSKFGIHRSVPRIEARVVLNETTTSCSRSTPPTRGRGRQIL